MRYLGTDNHSKKIMEGKFASNVQPKNFGKGNGEREPWTCPRCGRVNREYMARCFDCALTYEEAQGWENG